MKLYNKISKKQGIKDRTRLITLINDWKNYTNNEEKIMELTKKLQKQKNILPIIVAAGKGTRFKDSIKDKTKFVDKNLIKINNKTVIEHVLEKIITLKEKGIKIEKPIVIVNPKNKKEIITKLGNKAQYVIQRESLGTGDAVYQTMPLIKNFIGDSLVVWGSQPLIKANNTYKTILVHQATDSAMTFPTAKCHKPYAPLVRNKKGKIIDSLETHLEGAERPDYGEDNIGIFILNNKLLVNVLKEIINKYYNKDKYLLPKGEFGFPNMMIRTLAKNNTVLGLAMADKRECQGIKEFKDIISVKEYMENLG